MIVGFKKWSVTACVVVIEMIVVVTDSSAGDISEVV